MGIPINRKLSMQNESEAADFNRSEETVKSGSTKSSEIKTDEIIYTSNNFENDASISKFSPKGSPFK